MMKKIMILCHGNICRSPMCEFVLKNKISKRGLTEKYEVFSAGTSSEELGNSIHYGTRSILINKNIPFSERKAVQIKKSDYDKYDMFICMDKNNIRNALRIFGSDPEEKLSLLLDYTDEKRDVADPWWTNDFEKTYKDIVKGTEALISYLGE